MAEELLEPPSWDEVEGLPEYQSLAPEQKAETLSNWAKSMRTYGDANGWFDDQDFQKQFTATAQGKLKEIQSQMAPVTGASAGLYGQNPIVQAVGTAVDRANLGVQEFAPRAMGAADQLLSLATTFSPVGVAMENVEALQEGRAPKLSNPISRKLNEMAQSEQQKAQDIAQSGRAIGGGPEIPYIGRPGDLLQEAIPTTLQAVMDIGLSGGAGASKAIEAPVRTGIKGAIEAVSRATANPAVVRSAYVAGGEQALATLNQEIAQRMDAGETPEEAQARSIPKAITSGLVTMMTTRFGGTTGAESILKESGVEGLKDRVKEVLKEGGYEAVEETLDQAANQIAGWMSDEFDLTKPKEGTWETRLAKAVSLPELAKSGFLGGIIGSSITAVGQTTEALQNRVIGEQAAQQAVNLEQNNAPQTARAVEQIAADQITENRIAPNQLTPEERMARAAEILEESATEDEFAATTEDSSLTDGSQFAPPVTEPTSAVTEETVAEEQPLSTEETARARVEEALATGIQPNPADVALAGAAITSAQPTTEDAIQEQTAGESLLREQGIQREGELQGVVQQDQPQVPAQEIQQEEAANAPTQLESPLPAGETGTPESAPADQPAETGVGVLPDSGTPVASEAQQQPVQRVQLKGTPASFAVVEKIPQTEAEKERGEQFYRVVNERTNEEQVVEANDIAREIKPKSERVKQAIKRLPPQVQAKAEQATEIDTTPDPYQGSPLSSAAPLELDDNLEMLDELSEYGVLDENATGQTVLQKIRDSKNSPDWAKRLAQRLLEAGAGNLGVRAVYRPDEAGWSALFTGNEILFNLARNNPGVAVATLHEAAHDVTLRQIQNPEALTGESRKAYTELQNIYQQVSGREEFQGEYGVTSPQEMVAEAFSNPSFRRKLEAIKDGPRTLWQKFVNAISRLFFNKPAAYDSLLHKTIENAFTLGGAPVVQTKANGTSAMAENPEWREVIGNNNASDEAEAKAFAQMGEEILDDTDLTQEDVKPLTAEQRDLLMPTEEFNPIGLASYWAKQFSNIRGMNFDDRVGAAKDGLIKAAKKYDPSKGIPFFNYANAVIKNHMRNVQRNQKTRAKYVQEDAPIYEDETTETITSTTPSPEDLTLQENEKNRMRRVAGEALQAVMDRASERDQGILSDYARGDSLRTVGATYNMSQEGVRKVLKRFREQVSNALLLRGITDIQEIIQPVEPQTETAVPSKRRGPDDEQAFQESTVGELEAGDIERTEPFYQYEAEEFEPDLVASKPSWGEVETQSDDPWAQTFVSNFFNFATIPNNELSAKTRDTLTSIERGIAQTNPSQDPRAKGENPTIRAQKIATGRDGEPNPFRNESGENLAEFLDLFQKATGKVIRYVKAEEGTLPFAAMIRSEDPNVIYLNPDGDRNVIALVGHEWGHTVENQDPELYEDLKRQLLPYVDNWKKRVGEIEGVSYDGWKKKSSELTSNIIGDAFVQPEFWQYLRSKDQDLFTRAWNSFKRFIKGIVDGARKSEWGTEKFISDMAAVQSIVAETLREAIRRGPYPSTIDTSIDDVELSTPRDKGTVAPMAEKRSQVVGVEEIGHLYEPQSISQATTAVRENVFNGQQEASQQATDSAWTIIQNLTDIATGQAARTAGDINKRSGTEMGAAIMQTELLSYAVKLAAQGEPHMVNYLLATINLMPVSELGQGMSATGRALRTRAEFNSHLLTGAQAVISQADEEAARIVAGGTPTLEDLDLVKGIRTDLTSLKLDQSDIASEIEDFKKKEGFDFEKSLKRKGLETKPKTNTPENVAESLIEGFAKKESDPPIWNKSTENEVRKIVREDMEQRPDMGRKEPWKNLLVGKLLQAGVTQSTAERLADRVWRQHEIRDFNQILESREQATERGSLESIIQAILAAPIGRQSDPAWRQDVVIEYLRNAGLSTKDAEAAAKFLSAAIDKRFRDAQVKAAERAIKSYAPWQERAKSEPKKAKSDLDKILAAVRSRALDPTSSFTNELAKEHGWTGFTPEQFQRIAELDGVIQSESSNLHQKTVARDEIMDIVNRAKMPEHWVRTASEYYTAQALGGIPTTLINVTSPAFFAVRDVITDGSKAIVTNPMNLPNVVKSFIGSLDSWLSEVTFALKNDAYTRDTNEFLKSNKALKRLMEDGFRDWNKGDYGKGLGKILIGASDYTRRILSSLDQGAVSVMEQNALSRYGMDALRKAKIPQKEINQVMAYVLDAKNRYYSAAVANGMDQTTAWASANEATRDAWRGALAARNIDGTQVERAALLDALGVVGRKGPSPGSQAEEDMGIGAYPAFAFMNLISKAGNVNPVTAIFVRAMYGFFMIPSRTIHNALWYSPYGFLRLGVNSALKKSGARYQPYARSLATDQQLKQRAIDAAAGTIAMTLFALANSGSSDDEWKKKKFSLVVTGNGPSAKGDKIIYDSWNKEWKPWSVNVVVNGIKYPVNIGRGGEAILWPVSLAGAIDDYWLKAKYNEGKKTPRDLNGAFEVLGSMFTAGLVRGPYSIFTRGIYDPMSTQSAAEQVAAKAAFTGKTFVPILGNSLTKNISDFVSNPTDRSSMTGAMIANLPIVGPMYGKPALNVLGDPIRDQELNARFWKLGVPIVVDLPSNSAREDLYKLILKKGQGPSTPQRSIVESNVGTALTDEEWYNYCKAYGNKLSQLMMQNIKRLERLTPAQFNDELNRYNAPSRAAGERTIPKETKQKSLPR